MQTPLVQPFCSYGCENSHEGAELSRKSFTGFWGGMAALSALLGTWRQSSGPPRSTSVPSAPPCTAWAVSWVCAWLPLHPRVGESIPKDEVEPHMCACTHIHTRMPSPGVTPALRKGFPPTCGVFKPLPAAVPQAAPVLLGVLPPCHPLRGPAAHKAASPDSGQPSQSRAAPLHAGLWLGETASPNLVPALASHISAGLDWDAAPSQQTWLRPLSSLPIPEESTYPIWG